MRIDGMRWISNDANVLSVDPRERLSRVVASNVASVEFSVPAGGIYVVFRDVNPTGSDVGFRARVSVDGGSTFDTNYSCSGVYLPTGTEVIVGTTSVAQIQFLREATANAGLGTNMSGWLWLRTVSHPAIANFQFSFINAGGVYENCFGVGRYTLAGQITPPITNIQFFMESGNIQSGEFLAYRMFNR